MKIVCDSCGAKYQIADDKVAGKAFKLKCKKCGHIIVVNRSASEASSAQQADGGGAAADVGAAVSGGRGCSSGSERRVA